MSCGTDNIPQNIIEYSPHFKFNMGIFCGILLVPHNNVMELNNVMCNSK